MSTGLDRNEPNDGTAWRRLRLSLVIVGAAVAVAAGLSGCSNKATQVSQGVEAKSLNDGSVERQALPPLNVGQPLPPSPVPATFDVADLAEKVKPTVVNITTVQRVSAPQMGYPFEHFMGPEGGPPQGERQGAGTGFIIDPRTGTSSPTSTSFATPTK